MSSHGALALISSLCAGCAVEVADDPALATDTSAILGGRSADAGKWRDVAAVFWGSQQACTGTLIAPNIVLTAGHCNDLTLRHVILGGAPLDRPGEGESIDVLRRVEYPRSQTTEDLTVLLLAAPSRYPPRPIATGWARLDIRNTASVAIVGYGALDTLASEYPTELQEAETTITDAECSSKPGCRVLAQPAGELGAGGAGGIDTCRGDSGGPLFLLTKYGTFLAGVTSRSYDDATSPCGEGGIYVRPDKVVGWIEEQLGESIAHGPEPTAERIVATRGDAGETTIVHNDPKSKEHTYTVRQGPARGTIATRDDGRVRVCTDPATPTEDVAIIKVTDKNDASRTVDVMVPISVADGEPPAACDLTAFMEDGGCCDSGRGATGSIPLALGVLIVLRRRRRW